MNVQTKPATVQIIWKQYRLHLRLAGIYEEAAGEGSGPVRAPFLYVWVRACLYIQGAGWWPFTKAPLFSSAAKRMKGQIEEDIKGCLQQRSLGKIAIVDPGELLLPRAVLRWWYNFW